MMYTVLGAQGFVGSALSRFLLDQGFEVQTPSRSDLQSWFCSDVKRDLGKVIYCIGVTADFRQRPMDAVEAHVSLLPQIHRIGNIESFTYLSSSRIYAGCSDANEDRRYFNMSPLEFDSIYSSSKLMGECFTLQCMPKGRVARLSNVYSAIDYSSPNFLPSVLRDAARSNTVQFHTSPDSSKDFVSINDVVAWLQRIALNGKHRIYNLSSGYNTSNRDIAAVLASKGVSCCYAASASDVNFPIVDNARISEEFGFPKHRLLSDLPAMFLDFKQRNFND